MREWQNRPDLYVPPGRILEALAQKTHLQLTESYEGCFSTGLVYKNEFTVFLRQTGKRVTIFAGKMQRF